jgi:hypothetical protein
MCLPFGHRLTVLVYLHTIWVLIFRTPFSYLAIHLFKSNVTRTDNIGDLTSRLLHNDHIVSRTSYVSRIRVMWYHRYVKGRPRRCKSFLTDIHRNQLKVTRQLKALLYLQKLKVSKSFLTILKQNH